MQGRDRAAVRGQRAPALDESSSLAGLESAIRRFEIDSRRFFAGDLPAPPNDQRDKISRRIRRLRSSNLKGAAINFKLGTLEARFNSQLDLFGRRLRAREQGERHLRTAEPKQTLDPVKGVVVGPKESRAATQALYQGLYKSAGASPKMDLERFSAYIDRQAAAIRTKTGCSEIHFRIAVQDGKMKLKARPIRPSG